MSTGNTPMHGATSAAPIPATAVPQDEVKVNIHIVSDELNHLQQGIIDLLAVAESRSENLFGRPLTMAIPAPNERPAEGLYEAMIQRMRHSRLQLEAIHRFIGEV